MSQYPPPQPGQPPRYPAWPAQPPPGAGWFPGQRPPHYGPIPHGPIPHGFPQQWQQSAPGHFTGVPNGGFGPQAPPPRRTSPWTVVTVLLLGVALAYGVVAWADRDTRQSTVTPVVRTTYNPDPSPTDPPSNDRTTPPTTTEPPASTPAPTTQSRPATTPGVLPQRSWDQLPGPHSSNAEWVTLQQNKLYGYDIPRMTCPDVPSPFASAAQFREFATNTLNCQHNGWSAVFEAMGEDLPRPTVTFITSAIQSPCGKAGDEVSFYCGTYDGSHYGIYVHLNLMEQSNSWWRLRAFETLAHEYGHHVQLMAGLMWSGQQVSQAGGMSNEERSRRIELQTSCWAGRLLYQTASTKFSADDYATYIEWTLQEQDEYHGSAASNQYWWQRGLYMQKAGGCNTWTVGTARVS